MNPISGVSKLFLNYWKLVRVEDMRQVLSVIPFYCLLRSENNTGDPSIFAHTTYPTAIILSSQNR